MKTSRPTSTRDLLPSERNFLQAMQQLGFGRFQVIPIRKGELLLDPWPAAVQGIKFGSEEASEARTLPDEFQLKRHVADFFQYVRTFDNGEIRCLQVRHGLPVSMEVQHPSEPIVPNLGQPRP